MYEKYLEEAVVVGNYPDTGGITTDDDMPPGNINFGLKYKKTPYSNRLTTFKSSWTVDDDPNWKWDEFENCVGMEDRDNYSDTLKGLRNILGKGHVLNRTKNKSHAQRSTHMSAMNKEVPSEPLGKEKVDYEDAPDKESDITEKINMFLKYEM